MQALCRIFQSYQGEVVTVYLDGAPTVTATVIDTDRCAVTLLATSGSTVFIPYASVTAVQGFPADFPAPPAPPNGNGGGGGGVG